MENMLPGNSFPQICVVSVNESVGNMMIRQEYLSSMYLSNSFESYFCGGCFNLNLVDSFAPISMEFSPASSLSEMLADEGGWIVTRR